MAAKSAEGKKKGGKEVTALSTKVEADIVKKDEPEGMTISIQSVMGGTITVDEILARVYAAAPDAKEIYIKSEENKAYYVGTKNKGFVLLWE